MICFRNTYLMYRSRIGVSVFLSGNTGCVNRHDSGIAISANVLRWSNQLGTYANSNRSGNRITCKSPSILESLQLVFLQCLRRILIQSRFSAAGYAECFDRGDGIDVWLIRCEDFFHRFGITYNCVTNRFVRYFHACIASLRQQALLSILR